MINGTEKSRLNGHSSPMLPAVREDVEAERYALGCLLMGFDDERLSPATFAPGIRQTLFTAYSMADSEGLLSDPVSSNTRDLEVAAALNTYRVTLAAASMWNGAEDDLTHELNQCHATVTIPSLLDHYVDRLQNCANERRLSEALNHGQRMLADPLADRDELVGDLLAMLEGGSRQSFSPVSLAKLRKAHPHLREPIIHGLMRLGETVNVVSASKVGKSWGAIDLALSVLTGQPWLGKFETTIGRILYIDNELHPETIVHRLDSVAYARGLRLEDIGQSIDIMSLRGRLRDIHSLGSVLRRVKPGKYRIVILDALYRMLPAGSSENDNAPIAAVFNAIDALADRLQCGFVLVHHSTKGNQSGKNVTDVGSGAGSLSRAADSHLVLREHEQDGCYVLDAAVRSFAPVEPVVLRWEFPVWQLADELDAKRLKRPVTPREARQQQDDEDGCEAIERAIRNEGRALTIYAIAKATVMGRDRVRRLIERMEKDGLIFEASREERGEKETIRYDIKQTDTTTTGQSHHQSEESV